MGFDVDYDDELSDGEESECNHEPELMKVYPLRPSLFSNVPPYVQFIPVNGSYVFEVDPPEEMREMLWMVPTAPWYTISNCADLNGFTISEVRMDWVVGYILPLAVIWFIFSYIITCRTVGHLNIHLSYLKLKIIQICCDGREASLIK